MGYGAYQTFIGYYEGMGDPLYAVLSRRGSSVDWVVVEASAAELRRLQDVAHEILRTRSKDLAGERRSVRQFLQDHGLLRRKRKAKR